MGSVVIIIAIVVVVIGVPSLVARKPWKRENRSVSSHETAMAVLAALAERSKDGLPAPEPLPPDVDLRLGAPTAPSTVRTVPAEQEPAPRQPPAVAAVPLPLIEPKSAGDDTGIAWLGPVSEPLPHEEELAKGFEVPAAPLPPPAAPLPSRVDLWRGEARLARPAGASSRPPSYERLAHWWAGAEPPIPRPSSRRPPLGARPPRPTGPSRRPPLGARPPRPTGPPRRPWSPGARGRLRTKAGAGAAVTLLALAVAGAATALALSDGVAQHHKHQATNRLGGSNNATSPATSSLPTTLTPVFSNSGGATYSIPSSSFTLAVSATGPCWVEAKPSATSAQTVYEGILQAGATHTFSASGSLWLRVGYATHIQVSLDGTPVQMPSVGPSPFNLTFAATSA